MEDVVETAQRCFRQFPTIILGSGASAHYGLPKMCQIKQYILKQSREWDFKMRFAVGRCLRGQKFLENALDELQNMNSDAYEKTIILIWNYINSYDIMNFENWDNDEYNVGNLLLEMFESNRHSANIITTNYDRVVEYICHVNGLNYQIEIPEVNLTKMENINIFCNQKLYASRVVFIHKVHGSLSWFKTSDNTIVSLPTTNKIPSQCHPLIVPPGITKYKLSHQEPYRTVQRNADNVIEKSTSFLCVGFGFNDEHIQYKMEQMCSKRNIPVVVLAMYLSENAKTFLRKNAGANYMGIEKDGSGSKVYTPNFQCGKYIDTPNLWSMSGFCEMVLSDKLDADS